MVYMKGNEKSDAMTIRRKRRKRKRFTNIIFRVSCNCHICGYGAQTAYFKRIYNRSQLMLININGDEVSTLKVFPSRQQCVFLIPLSFSIPILPMCQSFLLIALSRFPLF